MKPYLLIKNLMVSILAVAIYHSQALAIAENFPGPMQFMEYATKVVGISEGTIWKYVQYNYGPEDKNLNEKLAPWAGNYMAMQKGGITARWKQGPRTYASRTLDMTDQNQFLSVNQTLARIKKMTPEQIDLLSPSEKYDIFVSDYEFWSTEYERFQRGPLRELKPQSWEGFCNGMRAAGICTKEPTKKIIVQNKEGISVPFEPADIKALLGAAYFYVEKYAQIGENNYISSLEVDLNPAIFDLAIRTFINSGKAFIIDSDGRVKNGSSEIWNESVVGYTRSTSQPRSLMPDEQVGYNRLAVDVSLTIHLLGEVDIETSNRRTQHLVANRKLTNEMNVAYTLYLDEQGQIVSGKWLSKKNPDFVWFAGGKGTDAAQLKYDGTHAGNRNLNFDVLSKLAKLSSSGKAFYCKDVFQ